jgi:copper chaperone CopZ
MGKATLTIPAISCSHCVMTVKRELGEIEGVESVEGNVETREITVQWSAPATMEMIKSTLRTWQTRFSKQVTGLPLHELSSP